MRENFFFDPTVKQAFDSYFLLGDTADLTFDTVKNLQKIGDTGLVGSVSSIPQFKYGDFEFRMKFDSLSPDSNDSSKFFGLRNRSDDSRGGIYFDLSYDTTATDSSPSARPFQAVLYDEWGNKRKYPLTWDTLWAGGGTQTNFRINWEQDLVRFLVNDTVYLTVGDGRDSNGQEVIVNKTIPQGIRIVNRSLDTTDSAPTAMKYLNIRNSEISWRERL